MLRVNLFAFTRLEWSQFPFAEFGADEAKNRVTHSLAHFADLSITSFMDSDVDPSVMRLFLGYFDYGRSGFFTFDGNTILEISYGFVCNDAFN